MKNEMGTVHFTNGEEEKCIEDLDAGTWRKETTGKTCVSVG